jgi:outer membrane protein assembly factor BamD (BamD/ComL family)
MARIPRTIRRTITHPRRQATRAAVEFRRAVRRQEQAAALPRDVWRWTAPKYRIRTLLLLMINAVLFAGLGCFTFWLRTGEFTPFAVDLGPYWDQWWAVFDPTTSEQITLFDFLLGPIPVGEVPLMLVIMGLVLASLTAVPVLVAMLYRFPFSLVFTGIVAFVAMLPWLGITVTFCCLLATWKRLQFGFRFATALLAMLPVVLYYIMATRNASLSANLPPLEVAKLYMPWVIAILAAWIVMAIVLTIARVVNYRPGAIAPLLAVMFAVPVVLFESQVGRDELYYRLIERQYGPASTTHFVDHLDASQTIRKIAQQRLAEMNDPRASLQSVIEQVRFNLQLHLESIDVIGTHYGEAFAGEQYEAIQACNRFLNNFPDSRYVPNVLYIKGQIIDTRVDRELFQRTGILRYYRVFPNAAALETWQRLFEAYPKSPLSGVAGYRLALLTVRTAPPDVAVDRAIAILEETIARMSGMEDRAIEGASGAGIGGMLAKRPAFGRIDVDPLVVALDAGKLRELLVNNRDPQQNDLPLRTLLSMNPRHPMYRENLEKMLAEIPRRFPLTPLRDNIEVRLAALQPSHSLRIPALRAVIEEHKGDETSDAVPHGMLELASAYQADNRPDEARQMLDRLRNEYPSSPWAQEAARRLALMRTPPRVETQPATQMQSSRSETGLTNGGNS